MRSLERNQRHIYLASLNEIDGMRFYKEPVPLYVNYTYMSATTSLATMGYVDTSIIIIRTTPDIGILFKTMDKVYVNKVPDEYDGMAEDANYQVKGLEDELNTTVITLTRLQHET